MLVIRILWLQAALAMAQLPTLDDLLEGGGGGGGQGEGGATVATIDEQAIAATEEAAPVPVPTIASTDDGLLDPILDSVVGPSGVLDVGAEVPFTSADVVEELPVTPAPNPILVPLPTPVETVAETPAPEVVVQPPELPTPASTPVTEAPPPPPLLPVPGAVDKQEEEVQQPIEEIAVPSPEPAPDTVAVPDPNPVPAPDTSVVEIAPPAPIAVPATTEAAAPAPEVTSVAAGGGAGVFVPPAVASPTQDGAAVTSPAARPIPSVDGNSDNNGNVNNDTGDSNSSAANNGSGSDSSADSDSNNQGSSSEALAAAQTTGTPVIQSAGAQEPVLTLVTADGSTFMSVFVPPAPTQAIAVIQGTGFPSSDASSSSDPSAAGSGSTRVNSSGPFVDTADPAAPSGPDSSSSSAPSSSEGLSMETKIGVGVGLGVGSVVLAVVVTYILWHRRMRSGPFRKRSGSKSRHRRGGADVEKGGSGSPPSLQERQKMDWESEHDMPFDFQFSRDRGSVKRNGNDHGDLRRQPGDGLEKIEAGLAVDPVGEMPAYRR